MDPAEITQISNIVAHQGALVGWQQEQQSQISESLQAISKSLQPRHASNPGGPNAHVSSPSTTDVVVDPPGNLNREPKIAAPSGMMASREDAKGFFTQ